VYRNRITEHIIIDSAELRRNPRNFRGHPESQMVGIRSLLGRVGIVKSLTAFYAPDDGLLTLIDGHARWQEGGMWPVEVVDLDQEEADLTLAMLDRTSAQAEIDPDALMALLDSLPSAARQSAGAAWSDDELAAIIRDTGSVAWADALGALPDGDRAPFQQMTFTLSDEQAEQVKAALDRARRIGPFVDTGNENGNGDALARICEVFNGQS